MATPREGGQFMSPHITGDYGTRNLSTEENMMSTTPMPQPNSDYLEPELVTTVKDAGYHAMLAVLGVEKTAQGSPAAMQNMNMGAPPPAPQQPQSPQAPQQPGQSMIQPPSQAAQLTPQQIQERASQPPATQNTPAMQAWNAFRA
jgi:hypothetical protein